MYLIIYTILLHNFNFLLYNCNVFFIIFNQQNLSDLCTGVHQHEIMLTVEACADDTLPVHYDTDESQMYYSLISDTTHTDEAAGASFFASSSSS